MERGVWQAVVHSVTKSWTLQSQPYTVFNAITVFGSEKSFSF